MRRGPHRKKESNRAVRLCDGGEDTVDNAVADCITCHAEKSAIERLGSIGRNPLDSHLSRNAFKPQQPQQLIFGDGTPDCLKADATRCRSNVLVHNSVPMPVASIIDEPVPYDPKLAQGPYNLHDCADFYYIDAGVPLDDPCEALPYAGPSWYWHENAYAIGAMDDLRTAALTNTIHCTASGQPAINNRMFWQSPTHRLKTLSLQP